MAGQRFEELSQKAGVADPGWGMGCAVGGYENDGEPDVYVANDQTPIFFYRNEGDWSFSEIGMVAGVAFDEDGREQAGMGPDMTDYNADGYVDIFVSNFIRDINTLYQNLRNGSFIESTFQAGLGEESLRYLGWGTRSRPSETGSYRP